MLRDLTAAGSAYDAVRDALAAQRCVILGGEDRRHVGAGCDVVATPGSVRRARQTIAAEGRHGEVAVALAIDADAGVDVSAAFADDLPDLVLVEGLSVLHPTLETTVEMLVDLGLPVWLSFRRCPEGLCGVHGQHWGGPEGDAFGRAARRFEELGVDALLVGGIPPDHVDGMISYLRDFTRGPVGVAPAWAEDADVAGMALRWREEGAQLIGGCAAPAQIAALRAALEGTRPGTQRRDGRAAAGASPPEPWRDAAGRWLYPLAFPDLVVRGDVFVPSQGSFLVWRHLFREQVGHGGRCLDVGCGTGLQAIQLALNGAAHVDAIDVALEAAEMTLINAFRNDVADRVSAHALDLYGWEPFEPYDVIVASLYQTPVDPLSERHRLRPADFWGRTAVDHLIRLLPRALAEDGVAYLLQVSLLSQRRTAALLEECGLQAGVVDFAFFPFTESFRESGEHIARVERLSDAHHIEIGGSDVMVGYLLEIRRRPAAAARNGRSGSAAAGA